MEKIEPLKFKPTYLLTFILLNVFLSTFYLDQGINWNSISRILPIMAYYEQGNFQIDKYKDLTGDLSYVNGHYYTDKAPLSSIVVYPFYKVAVSTGLIHRSNSAEDIIPLGLLASFLLGSIPFTVLLFILLRHVKKGASGLSPPVLIMLSVYGSMLFVFSGAFFSHLFSGLLLLIAYLLIQRKHFVWAGLLCGLAFTNEFPLGIFLPIWGLLIWYREKSFLSALRFGLAGIPAIVCIGYYNYYFCGSPWTMLYSFEAQPGFAAEFHQSGSIFGFSLPRLENIWEMLFGQYKGLLFHVPIIAWIIWLFIKHNPSWKASRLWLDNYFFLPVVAFTLLIVSKSSSWWGGWTYGPRYLIPVCFILLFEGLKYIGRIPFSRLWFMGISGFGLLCAWMAKATVGFGIPSEEKYPVFSYVSSQFHDQHFCQNNLLSYLTSAPAGWAAGLWLVLFILALLILHQYYPTHKEGVH